MPVSQATMEAVDIKQIVLSGGAFGPQEVRGLSDAIGQDFGNYRLLREAVQSLELEDNGSPAFAVRLGLCYFLLGRYSLADRTLIKASGEALGLYYLGRTYFAQEKFAESQRQYDAAAKAGYDANLCALGRAEALRYAGQPQAAMQILDQLFGPVEQTAEYLYQRGATVAALGGNAPEAVALLERAVDTDPSHSGALFALAVENDRRGNDDTALDLYERSIIKFPPHLGSLLNLGILYEDRHQYEKARTCYQRILDVYPMHGRARLFMKDASASSEMFYDEDAQRKRDRLGQLLSTPVADFELSVRSRNCLQKMGIMTLGDLTATSEQELLSSKNFGETSLQEIKEMMTSKGLQLGQFAHQRRPAETTFEPAQLTPDEQVLLNRPIADLNLSVRARKCMVRLGVTTIGELARHTGDELLECKNFGVTSLTEVREKLTSHGLRLRGD